MKRLEVTVPEKQSDDVQEVLSEYSDEVTSSDVEKEDKDFKEFNLTLDSEDIDELTEKLKELKGLETGDLTIDVLEETTQIEKGKRHEGGTSALSVQEMYTKAFEFSSFNPTAWALIALAVGIAVFGVVMENIMVVIGAMVIAPMLGPFISLSFGLVIGDRRLIRESMFYGAMSMLFGIVTAFLLSLLVSWMLPLRITSLMRLVAEPGFTTVPLSLLVGAAAALTFTTEMRESLAGVAVAIALVPPAAVAGLTLAMRHVSLFLQVSLVLLTNIMALLLAGSITFKLVGITPTTYYRKKVSEEQLRKVLIVSFASILVIGGIVGYLSYEDLQRERLQAQVDTVIDNHVQQNILTRSVDISGDTVDVTLAVVNPDISGGSLEAELEAVTNQEVSVTLIAVDGEVR